MTTALLLYLDLYLDMEYSIFGPVGRPGPTHICSWTCPYSTLRCLTIRTLRMEAHPKVQYLLSSIQSDCKDLMTYRIKNYKYQLTRTTQPEPHACASTPPPLHHRVLHHPLLLCCVSFHLRAKPRED
ncbi:hypothetical protein UPYG_G00195960 [Umbra pygmaea]|uniref:Uncharacterized protein n=1 Tax=Umbra pygmaea TaxID=75934 RepID=A0ABD0X3A1_UMBPY